MATHARQQYFADENSLSKERREFSIADEIQQKIDSIEPGAQVNKIETVKVNGTALVPDANKAVNVEVPEVIDNLYTVDSDNALSAKQGKLLYDYIQNIASRGRFLSNWNSATGLPMTNPSESPYPYKSGDYFIVSNVAGLGGTNYRPDGSSYIIGQASTVVETESVDVSDFYFYDGTTWLLLKNSSRSGAVDSSLSTTSTNPVENRVVTNAINGKQDILTAGTGININGTTISATGLTILEYGVSTWSDFTTAYNANRIVYCMVPVTGGNTMAFLAYVNTTVGNENAEFQYYRSISSHSDSSQGDEVYIYKLLSDGSWSTTTRKTYSKVAAGTNMTSSYSSGTITLNADSQLPTGGTNGQVLTQTNNGPAWQNPTGGDVLVSDQANNIFTPGMKIWGGTKSDFDDIVEDSNTAYLILADQPTPPTPGWQPGVNTIAYYPLTSVTTTIDMGGNNNLDLTNNGGVTFGINAGVDCASINSSQRNALSNQDNIWTTLVGSQSFTYCLWIYVDSFASRENGIIAINNASGNEDRALAIMTNYTVRGYIADGNARFAYTPVISTGQWYLLTLTQDGNNNLMSIYLNGSLSQSTSCNGSTETSIDILGIGPAYPGNSSIHGYVSNVIVENKTWTDTEISDYFNQTKGDYGIS